ncbi:flagellar hook-associated protein FlgK [Colwellia sp. 39_35_sub15_T18]|nr:flagellar hook-associated protein FlgK [Colwellia sp. 39_35_sub15_T18]
MTVSLYQTGVSGLLAAQQQLATTGHNISNVNTDGYTRQRAEQNASPGLSTGSNYLGSGTYVQDITRLYDQFSYKEQLLNQSNLGEANALNGSLNQLNDIMSFSGQAIMNSVGQFYQTVNGVADNPSDAGLRSIVLNQAEALASDFRSLNQNFDEIEKSINGEIEQVARKISEISIELAKINETILQAKDLTQAGQPNDLLDKRDQLVTELGQYTKVNTIEDTNGVMTVMIGNGTTLVAGITPLTVSVEAGDPDPLKTQLRLVGPNSTVAINGATLGGSLGGGFEFRDEHLTELRSEINRLAMAISATLNGSQADGLDLNGQQGANIFTDINTTQLQQGRVLTPSSNAGDLEAQVNITDVSVLPTDEFTVRYDGTDYIMTNMTTNASTNLGAPGSGTYATAFGFEFIETSGAPSNDDSFVIRPTENSAALMEVTLTDGAAIAASSAVEITPSDNNISAGQIAIVDMFDPVNAQAAMPIRIDVLEDPIGTFNYTITDNLGATSAPIAYTPPSQKIDLLPLPSTASFQIEISGTPSGSAPNAPEQFFIGDAFGLGNNSNIVAMAKTQEQGVTNGGKETFSQSLAISTSVVGSKSSSAKLVSETAEALFTQAFNRNQEASGVNLDEEAANLLRFQQAYQAASQIISVANTLFDTILSAVR